MYISTWLIVVIAVVLFFSLKGREKKRFEPIRISIQPKWVDLFKDYKIAEDNSWDNKVPEGKDYHILKHGINFTILEPELIYDDDRHSFKTTVDFRRQIDEVSPLKYVTDFVGIYVKSSIDGYEVGIRTPESHSKAFKEMPSYDKSIRNDEDLIKITTIPHPVYILQRHKAKIQEKIDAQLKKDGWKKDEYDAETQMVFGSSEVSLEHKYFTVFYEYI